LHRDAAQGTSAGQHAAASRLQPDAGALAVRQPEGLGSAARQRLLRKWLFPGHLATGEDASCYLVIADDFANHQPAADDDPAADHDPADHDPAADDYPAADQFVALRDADQRANVVGRLSAAPAGRTVAD
jgi:hypothetical protein